ncbi:hypothetical protein C8R26_1343 [Nitrosomonas oligotropha]|uniref:Uncharacterized protein n=1 Tax=Nitrosomonas oligotropha TaxID=42354 RepID=A0A2T5HDL3_9PROT|nr:hypothetical protein C8R26_1343 [Nitrosomonas oligotropha]
MLLLLMQYEKGKLCESRGRKVTDLTGICPRMAGLPDNTNRFNHVYDLTSIESNHFVHGYQRSSVLLSLRRNQNE